VSDPQPEPKPQLQPGTKIHPWCDPDRTATVMGYVYYNDTLWYVVVYGSGQQTDYKSTWDYSLVEEGVSVAA
jgi:hypothetical protein